MRIQFEDGSKITVDQEEKKVYGIAEEPVTYVGRYIAMIGVPAFFTLEDGTQWRSDTPVEKYC